MQCRAPYPNGQCPRTARTRGLCNRHYLNWYNDHRYHHDTSSLDPYILPAHNQHHTNRQPFWPLCTCTHPQLDTLPPFNTPQTKAAYCLQCGKPPLQTLVPDAQATFTKLLHRTTSHPGANNQ